MKRIVIIGFVVCCIAACKKNSSTTKISGDFSFGTAYNNCAGDCAKFYTIANGQLYADNMQRFTNNLTFAGMPLPNNKYLLDEQLLDEFPAYLLNNPDTTFGCPDCTDGGLAYITLKQNGTAHTWLIDLQRLQPELAGYIAKMQEIMDEL
ncbi:MAG TPA: hypothetical protein VHB48_21325 [Chitinophagaceae bacterium]|nr:hypothetical protein [Chitinophagaceae bacterium]